MEEKNGPYGGSLLRVEERDPGVGLASALRVKKPDEQGKLSGSGTAGLYMPPLLSGGFCL